MKKSDLENGMIIEFRDAFYGLGVLMGSRILFNNTFFSLTAFKEDLTKKGIVAKDQDIIRVYKNKNLYSIDNLKEDNVKEYLELIWERKKRNRLE